MPYTWADFKSEVKNRISLYSANDDLFVSAVAHYVKSMIAREVDRDPNLHRSYMQTFQFQRRQLLGYQPTLLLGSTLDVEVKKLLTVDADRLGIEDFITKHIRNAYQELISFSVLVEKLIRDAAIDLQSYIICYQVEQITEYGATDTTAYGAMSRAPLPEGAEVLQAFYIKVLPELAELDPVEAKDLVVSNGRTYRVITGGTLGAGELGSGLQTTDGSTEELGNLQFVFYSWDCNLRTEMVPMAWRDRFKYDFTKSDCCSSKEPARFIVDHTSYSFYGWPQLASDMEYQVFWLGTKLDFGDTDNTNFDEGAIAAAAAYVKAQLAASVEDSLREAGIYAQEYAMHRSRLYVDCRARRNVRRF